MEAVVWLALLAVLLIIEIVTMGLTTLWFAGGALVAFIVALVGGPLWLQITLFLFISIILLISTRPIAVKYLNTKVVKTNVDSMQGQKGIVTEVIDNIHGTGQVTVNGLQWTARAADEEGKITKDSVVVVLEVKGVKLIVEKEK